MRRRSRADRKGLSKAAKDWFVFINLASKKCEMIQKIRVHILILERYKSVQILYISKNAKLNTETQSTDRQYSVILFANIGFDAAEGVPSKIWVNTYLRPSSSPLPLGSNEQLFYPAWHTSLSFARYR